MLIGIYLCSYPVWKILSSAILHLATVREIDHQVVKSQKHKNVDITPIKNILLVSFNRIFADVRIDS